MKHILKSLWNDSSLLNKLVLFIFFVFGLFGILNHAMWRDELNGWLLARDSSFPVEFIQNIRYEGHPVLWYLCLYLLNQLTANPVAMQLFHLLLATAAIYLFINFSPFSKLHKILFCFGYLPFYEYLLISRNYALGLLFIFVFCTYFESRKKSYIGLAIILALMANSNAYSLCISFALFSALILEYIFKKQLDIKLKITLKDYLISLGIYLLGVGVSIMMLMPPSDSTLQGGSAQWMLQFDTVQLTRTLARIWNSYILIILPGDDQIVSLWLFAILAIGLFLFAATSFIKKPVVLFFYVVGTLEILLFTYIKFLGSPRHYGHLYIILIVSYWLASYYTPSNLLTRSPIQLPRRWLNFVSHQQLAFLTLILSAQLVAGIFSYSRDLILPYSASRETAKYIQSHKLDKMFIVGSEDFAIAPITAYLNRKIYYLESDNLGSFVLFTKDRETLDNNKILDKLSEIVKQTGTKVLLISNHKLEIPRKDLRLSPLAKFTHAFIDSEKYYLYLVRGEGY
mgnify:CR=1 FL=1